MQAALAWSEGADGRGGFLATHGEGRGGSSFAATRRRVWIRFLARIRVDLPVAIIDGMMVSASFVALLAIRFEGHIPPTYSERMFEFLPVALRSRAFRRELLYVL